MPLSKKKSEQLVEEVKKLRKKKGNLVCCDCPKRNTTYVNITQWTFVCTGCSGMLRNHNIRVKSIHASGFTEHEVENLTNGGNIACDKQYLAKFKEGKNGYSKPAEDDTRKIDEFMRLKYVDKRWYSNKGKKSKKKKRKEAVVKEPTPPPPSSDSSSSSSSSESESETPPPVQRKKRKEKKGKKNSKNKKGKKTKKRVKPEAEEVFSSSSTSTSKTTTASTSPGGDDWDAFPESGFGNTTVTANNDGFDDFNNTDWEPFGPTPTQQNKSVATSNPGDLLSAFGMPATAPPQNNNTQNNLFGGGFPSQNNTQQSWQQQQQQAPTNNFGQPQPQVQRQMTNTGNQGISQNDPFFSGVLNKQQAPTTQQQPAAQPKPKADPFASLMGPPTTTTNSTGTSPQQNTNTSPFGQAQRPQTQPQVMNMPGNPFGGMPQQRQPQQNWGQPQMSQNQNWGQMPQNPYQQRQPQQNQNWGQVPQMSQNPYQNQQYQQQMMQGQQFYPQQPQATGNPFGQQQMPVTTGMQNKTMKSGNSNPWG